MIADGYSPGSQFGYDLGAALQTMVTAIVQAIASLVRAIADNIKKIALLATEHDFSARVRAIADFIQANAPLFATVLGYMVLGSIVIRFGRDAFSAVVNWPGDLF